MQLREESLLQGDKYRIERMLGQGGFGITYLAIQSGLDRTVTIKEFFMRELCERDATTSHVTIVTENNRTTVNRYKEKFLKEARLIAKLSHPNIVRIMDVFEENGTAYYVMEYIENGSLSDMVKSQGNLPEPVATRYILQVADALDYIHKQKMNHLDVKPANIMLNKKDEAVLIDFGLSKQYDSTTGNQTSTTPVGISHGYAPLEQYKEGGVQEFSPETDIYALGATLFKLLTGITPPNASDVNEDGVPVDTLKKKGVNPNTIAAICEAMKSRKKERTKHIATFIERISASQPHHIETTRDSIDDESTITTDNVSKITYPQLPKARKSSIWKWGSVSFAFIIVISVIMVLLLKGNTTENIINSDTTQVISDVENPHASDVSEITEEHEYVDLGLSVKWATCNLGTNTPHFCGNYYAWGETTPKSDYSEATCKTLKLIIGDIAGNPEYDAARANWGGSWRMPTAMEFQELIDKCVWKWTTQNGQNGYHITSKKNRNSIFIPATGYLEDTSSFSMSEDVLGYYWCSTLAEDAPRYPNYVFFNDRPEIYVSYGGRHHGKAVRPVIE